MRVIYFDTNVLFVLYQYPVDITKTIIDILTDNYDDEIVIPFRAFFEYRKDRKGIIERCKNLNVLSTAEKEIEKSFETVIKDINNLTKLKNVNSFDTSFVELTSKIENEALSAKETILKELNESAKDYDNDYSSNDPVEPFAISHKSNVNYSREKQLTLVTLYNTRKSLLIPPGLTDSKKELDKSDLFRPAGDFIIWNEIIENACGADEVVFVTAENKKDFWEEKNSKQFSTILVDEFKDKNPKIQFTALKMQDFIEKYIVPCLSDNPKIIGFLENNKKMTDDIFINKSFLDLCFDGVYSMDNCLLDDYLGDSFVCGNINSFDDIYINNIEIITNPDDVFLDYDAEAGTIIASFKIEITGTCSIQELLYHDEGEDVCEYYSNCDYLLKVDVTSVYEFDGRKILFVEFKDFDHVEHEIKPNFDEDDYIMDMSNDDKEIF